MYVPYSNPSVVITLFPFVSKITFCHSVAFSYTPSPLSLNHAYLTLDVSSPLILLTSFALGSAIVTLTCCSCATGNVVTTSPETTGALVSTNIVLSADELERYPLFEANAEILYSPSVKKIAFVNSSIFDVIYFLSPVLFPVNFSFIVEPVVVDVTFTNTPYSSSLKVEIALFTQFDFKSDDLIAANSFASLSNLYKAIVGIFTVDLLLPPGFLSMIIFCSNTCNNSTVSALVTF